ncbi:MAG: hypothetical protein ACYC49_15860 [Ignavibacteriaceae bacterium]
MSIGAIGHSGYAMSALSAAYGTVSNSYNSTVAVPKIKKDSATISNAAKELAAKGTAKSSQEEASESASAKASEQASGDAS